MRSRTKRTTVAALCAVAVICCAGLAHADDVFNCKEPPYIGKSLGAMDCKAPDRETYNTTASGKSVIWTYKDGSSIVFELDPKDCEGAGWCPFGVYAKIVSITRRTK